MARGSAVQVAAPVVVAGHDVRSYIEFPRGAHKVLRVVSLVGAYGDAPRALLLLLVQHEQCSIAFGPAVGMGHHRGGNQPVAVLDQRMAQIAQTRLLAVALFVQPSVGIRRRSMRLVAALLAVEVRSIARAGTVLRTEALLRGPRLQQRTIDGEMFV